MKMSSQYRASAVGIRDYSYYSSPAFSVPVSSVQSNRLKVEARLNVNFPRCKTGGLFSIRSF